MSERVILELSNEVVRSARQVAERTHRRPEDVLVEWLDRAAAELPVEPLSDEDILRLCDAHLEAGEQEELSRLLAENGEGTLKQAERSHLDQLMQRYRRGLVCKARAWKVAVDRGLRPSLG